MDFVNIISSATALAAILSVGSVLKQRNTIQVLKDNNNALTDQVNILKEETKSCRDDHLTSQGQIAELKSQLEDFRDLPLRSIQATQADILVTQKAIVGLLKKIENNQPDKDKVARAVRQVKTDLMAS